MRDEIVVDDQIGTVYVTGNLHMDSHASAEVSNCFAGGDPFANGAHRMDLLLNGIVAASTAFTVGAATTDASQIRTEPAIGN